MEEFKLYIKTLKMIIDRYHEKETIFYTGDGKWYSRYHSREITPEELTNWVLELTKSNDSDYCFDCPFNETED